MSEPRASVYIAMLDVVQQVGAGRKGKCEIVASSSARTLQITVVRLSSGIFAVVIRYFDIKVRQVKSQQRGIGI